MTFGLPKRQESKNLRKQALLTPFEINWETQQH